MLLLLDSTVSIQFKLGPSGNLPTIFVSLFKRKSHHPLNRLTPVVTAFNLCLICNVFCQLQKTFYEFFSANLILFVAALQYFARLFGKIVRLNFQKKTFRVGFSISKEKRDTTSACLKPQGSIFQNEFLGEVQFKKSQKSGLFNQKEKP